MAKPTNNVQIEERPHDLQHGIRRWREGKEVRGRDNRPCHYSITGGFIVLPDSVRNSRDSDRHS
jgi:hypothetical protein